MSTTLPTGIRFKSQLMRATVLVASLAMAVVALTFAPSGNAFAATQDFTQCNGVLGGGGTELRCDITVTNNLNLTTGTESSEVTTTVCQGPNGAPICADPVTKSYDMLTKSVNQCNGSVNGGGSTITCNVTVVNNITGAGPKPTGATVNQCNNAGAGGGTAPTLNCDPSDATTTDATITQCNYSVNGGGAPERVTCSVLPSTQSALLPVSINQCNDSANGGGSDATCSASLTNNIRAAGTTVTPLKNVLHDSQTDGFGMTGTNGSAGVAFLGSGVLLLLAGGLLTAALATRKVGARR